MLCLIEVHKPLPDIRRSRAGSINSVNRSDLSDSQFWLDGPGSPADSPGMNTAAPLYLERRDPARNMARFYALELAVDLLGDMVVIRRWGRIGTRGRQVAVACDGLDTATQTLKQIENAKRRRGYRERS